MAGVRFACCVALLVCFQTLVSAHFTLTYPSSRGFDDTKEATAPCGGFDTPSAQRVQIPLDGAFIEINSGHTSYTYIVNALAKNNPTVADFSNTSSLVQVAQGGRAYPQAACLPLAFNDIKPNTNVTLQVVYNGGDGLLYQCVDAVVVDAAPSFNKTMCVNADGSDTSSVSSSAPAASATGTSASQGSTTQMAYGLTFIVAVCISVLLV
ncbi:uncharacterized protein EV154DRAFT_553271 [Mucor mucedo]|uniref:uncharacterized protein n=1 Tax=Mucor mucedo TaxID=29922 RepID=UPI00221F315A|nr:uncharacterized protein EV154DRAFT_553271 [Mucor mucedo]KAI7889243.1 hypothetical protein EV154DRAFT_553271 [Mucor mucedo]